MSDPPAIEVVAGADLEAAIREGQPLPGALPVLPIRDLVAFPDALTPLAIGQERSVRLVNEILAGERALVLLTARNAQLEEPGPDDLYRVGVAGVVARMLKVPVGIRSAPAIRWASADGSSMFVTASCSSSGR